MQNVRSSPPERELSTHTSDRMLRRWNNISIYNRAIAREREGANSKDSDRFHNFAIFILQTNFNVVSKLLKSVSLLGLGSPLPLTRWGPDAGTRPLASLLCNPGCTPPPSYFLDISGYGPSFQTHGPLSLIVKLTFSLRLNERKDTNPIK